MTASRTDLRDKEMGTDQTIVSGMTNGRRREVMAEKSGRSKFLTERTVAGDSKVDHILKEIGIGSSMLVNRAGANGNEEPGRTTIHREANHNRFHTGTWGYHRSRGNPQRVTIVADRILKTQCTTTNGGRTQPDSMSTWYKEWQDMADLSIFVIEFGITRTTTAHDAWKSPTQSRKERDIYLSYADSYMMLEGRFCQRRLENINYDWIDLMWHNTTKAPIQGTTGPVSENLLNNTTTGSGVDHSVEGSPELNRATRKFSNLRSRDGRRSRKPESGVADSVEGNERQGQNPRA
ncbi:hypothetical protein BV898_19234 [Hypsibius exemplaris]|uniref:Uncharacterized protein n=1 Tax=Hypsibius exemplaris TaxID=2072580 RepID=A0A9X6NLB0_HYPEX|nr:hypothetical protein BV898_19234 [Hypsibius exemplaris]